LFGEARRDDSNIELEKEIYFYCELVEANETERGCVR